MSQCPYANFPKLIDPDTYREGMRYNELARIRASGPIHYMDDPTMGIPYWLVTGRDAIDFISKDPARFSSEARSNLVNGIKHMHITFDPEVKREHQAA